MLSRDVGGEGGAVGAGRALRGRRAQLVEAGDHRVQLVGRIRRRVTGERTVRIAGVGGDGAVEHEPPDPIGVRHGVDGAERGAVAETQVVQAFDAERPAHVLEVEGGVSRADVGEEVAGALDAVGDQRQVGHREGAALDRRFGEADAARVPTDGIELEQEVGRQDVDEPPCERGPWATGSAGLEHERAAVVAGRQHRPRDRRLHRRAVRVGVVERDVDPAALPVERQLEISGARTGPPAARPRARTVVDDGSFVVGGTVAIGAASSVCTPGAPAQAAPMATSPATVTPTARRISR